MWCVRDRAYASFRRAAVAASLLLAGCTTQTPTAPDPSPAKVDGSSPSAAPSPLTTTTPIKPSASFGLLDGNFVFTTGDDSTLTGTYTGTANVGGTQSVALALSVTGGTGAFQGANGSLKGEGSGSFVGEGSFSLSLKGSIRTAVVSGAVPFRAELTGSSHASCSTDARILLNLEASGTSQKHGAMTASMHHVVSNTSCQ